MVHKKNGFCMLLVSVLISACAHVPEQSGGEPLSQRDFLSRPEGTAVCDLSLDHGAAQLENCKAEGPPAPVQRGIEGSGHTGKPWYKRWQLWGLVAAGTALTAGVVAQLMDNRTGCLKVAMPTAAAAFLRRTLSAAASRAQRTGAPGAASRFSLATRLAGRRHE